MYYEEEDFLFTIIAVLVIVAIVILGVVAFAPKQISEEKLKLKQ